MHGMMQGKSLLTKKSKQYWDTGDGYELGERWVKDVEKQILVFLFAIQRMSLKYVSLPCIKQIVGHCCIMQGVQPDALWQTQGVEYRWEVGSKRRCMWLLVTQSSPALCDSMDCSPPDSYVYGILQARVLEWIAIPFSRGIFPTQGLNSSLLHFRQILYSLRYQRICILMADSCGCTTETSKYCKTSILQLKKKRLLLTVLRWTLGAT